MGGAGDDRAAHLDAPPDERLSTAAPLAVRRDWIDAARTELASAGLDGRSYLVVQPGSGSPAKNWPAERFAHIIDRVRASGGPAPLVLTGPADAATLARLHQTVAAPVPTLANLPLTTVAGILAGARAFLGNDSGLSHLAGLLGVPTLALFGPTDPALWAPLGPRVRVLRHEPLDALPVDEVVAALDTAARAR